MLKSFSHYTKQLSFRLVFTALASALLVSHGATSVAAVTPLPQGSALSTAATKEINRRLAEITINQTAIKSTTVLPAETKTKLTSSLNTTQEQLNDQLKQLNGTSDPNKIKSIATAVDKSFDQYQAVNSVSKLTLDLQSQAQLTANLNTTAKTVQQTVDAAKAKGATHVNAGVGGFVSLKSVQTNLDQLKDNIRSTTTLTNSTASTLSIPISSGLTTPSTIPATAFGQLSVSQSSLSNTGAGLSQLGNLVTGNKFGLNYCGMESNCSGQTNNGAVAICGIKSNCSNSTNNGAVATCGIKSDCSDSTNNGLFANCGIESNCSGSTNNGAASICGVKSDCSNSTNNGGVAVCGIKSDCSGSTNNGILMICGVKSNCSNSTNNGFMFVCGDNSDCSGSSTRSTIFICGSNSNCSTTVECEEETIYVDDEPVTQRANR